MIDGFFFFFFKEIETFFFKYCNTYRMIYKLWRQWAQLCIFPWRAQFFATMLMMLVAFRRLYSYRTMADIQFAYFVNFGFQFLMELLLLLFVWWFNFFPQKNYIYWWCRYGNGNWWMAIDEFIKKINNKKKR